MAKQDFTWTSQAGSQNRTRPENTHFPSCGHLESGKRAPRKHYIDNLRNFTILLLFPVHTFMIWNNFGSGFYIWEGENKLLSTCIVLVNPWLMPLLFVLAGMSARYALEKRTGKDFAKERVHKLLVPFLSGMIFLVPVQTFFARKYFEGYTGSYLDNMKYFFTHVTDFSGYDGALTPGHLWFILFLFLISMAALLLSHCLPYEKTRNFVERMPVLAVWMLFLPIWLAYYLGNFGGYSIGKDLALYLAGYYVLSSDNLFCRIEQNIKWLAGLCILGTIVLAAAYYNFSYYGDLWVNYIGWNTVLVMLAWGKKFLDKRTKATVYLNQASYPIYLLHQSILVALAYYTVQNLKNFVLQVFCISMGSFMLTILAYHLLKKVPVIKALVGIKK